MQFRQDFYSERGPFPNPREVKEGGGGHFTQTELKKLCTLKFSNSLVTSSGAQEFNLLYGAWGQTENDAAYSSAVTMET